MEVSTRNLRKYRIRGEENEECKISMDHATYRSVGSGTKVFGQYMQNCLSNRAKQRFYSEVLNDPGENGRCGNGPLKDNQRSLEIHISAFYSPYDFLFDYDTFINFHYRWPKNPSGETLSVTASVHGAPGISWRVTGGFTYGSSSVII